MDIVLQLLLSDASFSNKKARLYVLFTSVISCSGRKKVADVISTGLPPTSYANVTVRGGNAGSGSAANNPVSMSVFT